MGEYFDIGQDNLLSHLFKITTPNKIHTLSDTKYILQLIHCHKITFRLILISDV